MLTTSPNRQPRVGRFLTLPSPYNVTDVKLCAVPTSGYMLSKVTPRTSVLAGCVGCIQAAIRRNNASASSLAGRPTSITQFLSSSPTSRANLDAYLLRVAPAFIRTIYELGDDTK